MTDNADQIAYWNETAGAKWVANQARLDRVFTPLTKALIDGAEPRVGERVLDVGCGCGETSLLASARVGATGQVVGVDISRPMLTHARTRSAAGLAPITWLEADAMTHGFAHDTDLLISRFGVMFFADQLTAFRNLRRAMKPAGRFALLCWRPRAEVEWMQWPLDVVADLMPAPVATTGEPGPFGLADAEATTLMLAEAGFSAVRAEPIDVSLSLGIGATAVADAMAMLLDTGPAAVLFREADLSVRDQAVDLLETAVAKRATADGVPFGAACWLYRGEA